MKQDSITNYNQFIEALETLGDCTDDYIFFSDLNRDSFTTSEAAAQKYGMPGKSFNNALKVFASFMHPEDYPQFVKQITDIKMGVKDSQYLECRWFDNMGNTVWVSCHSKLLKGKNGNPDIIVGTVSELGRKRQADNTTGFRGMLTLIERLKKERPKDGFFMRLFVRNMYEQIVKHGEENVNPMLRLISNAIRNSLGPGQDCYYHSRGVFMILSDKGDENDAFDLFKNISDTAARINAKSGFKYAFKLRTGVVPYRFYDINMLENIKKCEFAASFATTQNSKSFYAYNDDDYREYKANRELFNALQVAVQHDFRGFDVYYQPIFDAKTKKLFACEALLRYQDDKFGVVSPEKFIPLLEENGLIIPLGRWVLKMALDQCREWQDIFPDMHINVNLSYVQMEREEIMREIFEIITSSDLDNRNLVLEFTESGNILNDVTREYIKLFNDNNINLALDDFGMGYSNLLYLSELNVDFIKIDRTFVAAINNSDYSYDIIRHITEIAHSTNTKICIEGIENEEELKKIDKLQPDYYQGFYFCRPISPDEFEKKYM